MLTELEVFENRELFFELLNPLEGSLSSQKSENVLGEGLWVFFSTVIYQRYSPPFFILQIVI